MSITDVLIYSSNCRNEYTVKMEILADLKFSKKIYFSLKNALKLAFEYFKKDTNV
jgi:hypothetical protein